MICRGCPDNKSLGLTSQVATGAVGLLALYWKSWRATVAIFGFQGRWNDFFGPLIYLNRREHYTLALGLRTFQNEYGPQWHYLMAISVIVMLPILVLFYFAQRYLMEGIVVTGLKG